MSLSLSILAITVALVISLFVWVRVAPLDGAAWHVDPTVAPDPTTPNFAFIGADRGPAIAPIFDRSPQDLARDFDRMAQAQPQVRLVAGDPASLMMTYVQRSRIIGYPDYITVKFIALKGGKSTLAIFSRARFGYSDAGVNKARLQRWLARLQ